MIALVIGAMGLLRAHRARLGAGRAAARNTSRRRAASRCRQSRIVFRHLLPNCLPPLIVVATVQVARAIALEATLSFLGLGVPITEPSLGLLIANGYSTCCRASTGSASFPGIALLSSRSSASTWSATSCATCSTRGCSG